ncbi:hypothetical protein ABSA28_00613 [Candidatus Hepatincolaceae symbiont of Richtersius coronifer]
MKYLARKSGDIAINLYILQKLPLPRLETETIKGIHFTDKLLINAVILSYMNAPEHFKGVV